MLRLNRACVGERQSRAKQDAKQKKHRTRSKSRWISTVFAPRAYGGMKTCQNLLFRKLDRAARVWVKAMVTGKVTGNRPFRARMGERLMQDGDILARIELNKALNKIELNKTLNNEDV